MTIMPGYPVADGELCFISTDQQPSSLDACAQLSAEEKLAAEQSLSVFCKPVEFYNILHHRATISAVPLFLPRCFEYRIQARDNKRIQITVFLSWSDEETQNMFPFYVSLARRNPKNEDADYSTVYLLSQIVTIRGSSGADGNRIIKAEFTLCEVNKLAAEANSGSLFLLFFTTEGNSDSSSRVKASLGPSDPTSHESLAEKNCLYGKISFQSIYLAWKNSPNFRWGQRAEIKTTLELLPCVLKYDFVNKGTTIAIQDLWNFGLESTSKSVEIKIFAEEIKAMEKSRNRRNTLPSSSSSRSSLSRVIRLKEGNVTFNYRYYNNKLQRTEVSENFSCPFCLIKWGSYKGLRCHLLASHDFFKFEFSASEDCLAVNVSLNFDIWRFELVGDGVDPKLQTFFLHGKRMTHISPENACFEVVQDVDPPTLANNEDPPALANNADPPALAMDEDPPALAMDEDPPVLAMDEDPPVLAIDADSPVLATDADPPVLATDADPPVLATDADPPVLATDADPPVLATVADPPVLATVADPPVLTTGADPPVLAMDVDPPVLPMDADPPVLAMGANPPVLAVGADPSVLAVGADPPVLAVGADLPVLAVDADLPVLAVDADQPVLAVDADQPVLAVDADPSLLARNADPPVLAMDADPLFSESETPLGDNEFLKKIDGNSATISGDAKSNANIVPNPNPDCVPIISKHGHGTSAGLQIGNTGKLPVEHFDPQNIARLKKRQFYHSHKAQAMCLDEVLSNYDSEDDVDDEVADIEERVKLDLQPLSKEEKQFMFMWNSFIRKQRVRIDSHIRWACKAFSVLHGSELVKSRELTWYWTMFRIKLYNLGLIDGKIITDCSNILEQHVKHNSNPEIPVANINSIHLSPLKNKRSKKITQKVTSL
ncbi:polycomb group protein EMBRYONIC FLOWER 2-like isoform X3 [Vicia villosa]|uniref:polycomb group protein EMBRYONIC FLOWER 2-like isoform X3 n=1 Tax=Vicia villosa TaxID=3911 RepID=UPI00273BCAC3|nr:polycomb group protein EMBRYONIC FLOWER 2-like isoform X3 [Vicia villosa]